LRHLPASPAGPAPTHHHHHPSCHPRAVVALKLNGIQVPLFSVTEAAEGVKANVMYALRALSVTEMDVGVERFSAPGSATYQLSISKAKVGRRAGWVAVVVVLAGGGCCWGAGAVGAGAGWC
jgi:hypothetical protein